MAEASVPYLGGAGDGETMMLVGGSGTKRIELPCRITSEKHRPCSKILDREAKGIKFHRDRVITSQSSN
jgi:hypothetical protein